MNQNTVTPTPHNITNTPCNITNVPHIIIEDHSTEESEGCTQFLQIYRIQLNNLIDPDDEHSDNRAGQAEDMDENLVQETPVSTSK